MAGLFPFQVEGAQHLVAGRARLLADEMGLGKTVQAIRASEIGGSPSRRVTVICPAIMCAEWAAEWAAWHEVPRSVAIVGAGKADWSKADAVICSYDRMARGDLAATLAARRDSHVIFDEAHYLKDPESKRTRAALGANANGRGGIAERAARVSFLTGTPAPNHAGELYPMLSACGVYDGTYWEFFHEFCTWRQTEYGPRVTGYRNADGLRSLLHAVMLRRTNAVELPPTEYGEIEVDPRECGDVPFLTELRRLDANAEGLIRRAASLESFADLDTPHVSTLRRLIGLAKVAATAEHARDQLLSDPAAKLVTYWLHRGPMEIFAARMRDLCEHVVLAGGVSDKVRKANKDRFQTDPDCRLAICQMKAAGIGLTLTAANHLWIVEPSWTPADNDQAVKRIVRIGQRRTTSIKYVTLSGSIEAAVNEVLRKKRQLVDIIIN